MNSQQQRDPWCFWSSVLLKVVHYNTVRLFNAFNILHYILHNDKCNLYNKRWSLEALVSELGQDRAINIDINGLCLRYTYVIKNNCFDVGNVFVLYNFCQTKHSTEIYFNLFLKLLPFAFLNELSDKINNHLLTQLGLLTAMYLPKLSTMGSMDPWNIHIINIFFSYEIATCKYLGIFCHLHPFLGDFEMNCLHSTSVSLLRCKAFNWL